MKLSLHPGNGIIIEQYDSESTNVYYCCYFVCKCSERDHPNPNPICFVCKEMKIIPFMVLPYYSVPL